MIAHSMDTEKTNSAALEVASRGGPSRATPLLNSTWVSRTIRGERRTPRTTPKPSGIVEYRKAAEHWISTPAL